MLKSKPMFPTSLTPNEIIGQGNINLLKSHLQISLNHNGELSGVAIAREIGQENRPHIAKALNDLKENGYYPIGVSDSGIIWGVVTKSDLQIKFEEIMEKEGANIDMMTTKELKERARAGYVKLRQQMGGFKDRDGRPSRQEVGLEVAVNGHY